MTEIKIDVELPDIDREDVFEALVSRAANMVIDHWMRANLEAARRAGTWAPGKPYPDEASSRELAIYRLLQQRIAELVTARIDATIEAVLEERIADESVAARVRARLDSVLDEPVDQQGRSIYRGTLKTRRIDHCLDKAVRGAIIRHVGDAAKQAVDQIQAEARRAFGAAVAEVKARLVKEDGRG